jgi:pimeloyl-ACP methyl ester carboxylesterase
MGQERSNGRVIRSAGPEDAEHRVLMLPGGGVTAAFYDEVLAEPVIAAGDTRLIATTLPGFGGVPLPDGFDCSMEGNARYAAELASDLGCDAVLGHSLGANIAIEMAIMRLFRGPLVLLAPSLSLEDEFKGISVVNRIGKVPGVGYVAFALMRTAMAKMIAKEVPADRVDALAADIRLLRVPDMRSHIRHYVDFMSEHGSRADLLCASGVEATVVLGDEDEVGITDAERGALEACPTTRFVSVPGVGHMIANQRPALVAELILKAVHEGVRTPIR